MTPSSAAGAAATAEEQNQTSTSTCSKVLYDNSHCGQPVVSDSVDYCTVSLLLGVDENSREEEEEDFCSLLFSFP